MRGYWKYLIFVVFLVFCGVITFLLISLSKIFVLFFISFTYQSDMLVVL